MPYIYNACIYENNTNCSDLSRPVPNCRKNDTAVSSVDQRRSRQGMDVDQRARTLLERGQPNKLFQRGKKETATC